MDDYKKKYLKYKNKYFKLKNQLGGGHNIDYKIPNITIAYSEKIKDRGAFANQSYKEGDTIEICPALQQSKDHSDGNIKNYLFHLNETTDLVGFGYCSMYNHSDNPNASWIVNDDNILMYATRDINEGEEIFISYGSKWFDNRNMSKL
jgi:SET domain-containing protein